MTNIFTLLLIGVLLFAEGANAQIRDREMTPHSHRIHFQQDTAAINNKLSRVLEIAYNYPDSARTLVTDAYLRSKESVYYLGVAQSLILFGRLDENDGDYERAVEMYKSSIPYLLKAERKIRIAVPYINMANAYFFRGAYDLALKTYYDALKSGKRYQRPLSGADSIRIYLNIALTWDAMGSKEHAADALRAAERIPAMFSDSIELADYYSYAAHIYADAKPIEAIAYHRKALQVGEKQHSNASMLPALNSIASIYTELEDSDSAKAYLQKSEVILDGHPNAFNYHRYHYRHQLGRIYLLQKRYKDATEVLTSLNADIRRLGILDLAIDLERDLSKLYERTGNYSKALQHAKNYASLKDTLLSTQSGRSVALWSRLREAENKTEYVNGQLKISQQQGQLQRKNMLLAVIMVAGVLMVVILVLTIKNYRRKQVKHANAMTNLRQKMEIDRLSAHIEGEEKERERLAVDLHDNIGGLLSAAVYTLETAKSRYPDASFDTLERIVNKIRHEIRKTSHTLMPDPLFGQSLSETVSQYCAFVEQETGLDITLQERGNFKMMPIDLQLGVYRIIQELLQNILKHARATTALLQLNIDEDIFSLTVEDNGIGLPDVESVEGKGIRSITERLLVVGGHISYNTECGKGTSVYVELPINYEP